MQDAMQVSCLIRHQKVSNASLQHVLYKQIISFTFVFIKYKNERNEYKFEKSDFYKNKKVTNIDVTDVNKTLVSKEERSGKKNHLSTLLNTIIMMLLDIHA